MQMQPLHVQPKTVPVKKGRKRQLRKPERLHEGVRSAAGAKGEEEHPLALIPEGGFSGLQEAVTVRSQHSPGGSWRVYRRVFRGNDE